MTNRQRYKPKMIIPYIGGPEIVDTSDTPGIRKMGWRQISMLWRTERAKIKPRRERQRDWLIHARDKGGITLQVEGGYGYDHDLRDLVKRGLLRMDRVAYSGLNTNKHGYQLSRSVLRLTQKGLDELG